MFRRLLILPLLLALTLLPSTPALAVDEPILPLPVPDPDAQTQARARLGQALFHDVRLSADNTVSCASCHGIGTFGVDRRATSIGIGGMSGTVNAPTVYNSRYNVAQFWDGRAATLEEQAAGPVHNPVEMGSNWEETIAKLSRDENYRQQFAQLYEGGITGTNIQAAIAEYERTLVTIDAPFDRYLRGDKSAISAEALEGYRLFKGYGCVACHQGINVGGNMFARMGAMDDYYDKSAAGTDLGRYNVTGNEADRHVFKVPSLRLAVETAPYFHDGQVSSLAEAIRIMARHQLGRTISSEEIGLIIAFLESLVGTPYILPAP